MLTEAYRISDEAHTINGIGLLVSLVCREGKQAAFE